MARGTRVLAAITVFVVVAAAACAYVAVTRPSEQTLHLDLGIQAGTVIHGPPAYRITFTVVGVSERVTGAWYADHGGFMWIMTPDKDPTTWYLTMIEYRPWNGTVDVSLVTGIYVIGFAPGPGGSFLITEPIRAGFPGGSPATDGIFLSS